MERRKENRLSVELPGSFQASGQGSRGMFFSQISSKGCRLAAEDLELDVGDSIEVYLGAMGPIEGVVRWAGKHVAGVEFNVALDGAVVDYFAVFINDVA